MSHPPSAAALGGGHGLSASLSALRRITDRLTAIVTVADDGGSSGRLREEFDILPPGDLRMALAALCGDDRIGRSWADILQSRFRGDGPLGGHAIGNLLIAGLWQRFDPVTGLDMVAELLHSLGRVLPMSLVPLAIEADVLGVSHETPDEVTVVRGQATVAKTRGAVQRVRLLPADPPAAPAAVAAVREADFVILGPGSWFTSVIPHLLVPDLADAIVNTRAHRILTLNIEAAAETAGLTAGRHIEVLAEHAPTLRLDTVLADVRLSRSDRHIQRFVESLGGRLMIADVAMRDGTARHDPNRLAAAYAEIMGL
nr:uridine diphosphate-N-acetylglucosamine-binding protein YvcK [Propionicicella superfundia]